MQPTKESAERGLHLFIFLSFIFALCLAEILPAWVSHFDLPDWLGGMREPRFILLATISLLIAHYWWVLYQLRGGYGKDFFRFLKGPLLEAGSFFIISSRLRAAYAAQADVGHEVKMVLIFLAVLVVLFMIDDYEPAGRDMRQFLRLEGILLCLSRIIIGAALVFVAVSLLVLAILYVVYRNQESQSAG